MIDLHERQLLEEMEHEEQLAEDRRREEVACFAWLDRRGSAAEWDRKEVDSARSDD